MLIVILDWRRQADGTFKYEPKSRFHSLFASDRLLWILLTLGHREGIHIFEVGHILDELDYITSRDRITPLLAERLSDMAIVNEMLEMI